MMKAHFYYDLPAEDCGEGSKIAIVPVPFDGTSTWQKGADKGPEAILEASQNVELYDIETDSEVYKQGIYTDSPVKEDTPEKMIAAVKERVEKHTKDGKFVVVIGGEHSVSIGAIQAHAEKKITVLQLDAHSDLRESYNGSKYSHACAMARAKEHADIVQVGIRSMDISEKKSLGKVFFARDIHGKKRWEDKVVEALSENVYITIDLDVFDPSIMPSTGTPEPGGLDWYEVTGLLKKVADKRNIIGFDVVELCPNPGNKSPDFLAAKLIYKALSYKFR
ncbi:MAG: agmatinase [Nanoarchaeota archaeon]|nr:agmatinase [Nanoarchaeota archaeon]